MLDGENTQTKVLAIHRNSYQIFRDTRESDDTANHCTMFVIGTVAFLAGFWAVICLVSVVLQDGPLGMLKNLAKAVVDF